MTGEFASYFRLGLRHILDPGAIDHLLFIAAMTAPFAVREWRSIVLLVTAFTVGHSLTLALATLDLVRVPPALVEALIPVTILATAAITIWRNRTRAAAERPVERRRLAASYAVTLGFGLIHGLGFSTFLRALLGGEENIVWPLFSFNVGLEAAQLVVVAVMLVVGTAVAGRLLHRRAWTLAVSAATALLSVQMLATRLGAG